MPRPHRPKAGPWIRICVLLIYPITWLSFRMRFLHRERIPAPDQGPVIVAINHLSALDTIVMARLVWSSGRVPRFLIKAAVFRWPVAGPLMRRAAQIPVYRGTKDASASLSDAVAALQRGEAVVMYPEGTITRDPLRWPMQARTGIARLVLLSPDTPVVPVGQWGAHHRIAGAPRSKRWRRPVVAGVGHPIDLARFRGREPDQETLHEITETIMTAIRAEVARVRGEAAPQEVFTPTRSYVDRKAG